MHQKGRHRFKVYTIVTSEIIFTETQYEKFLRPEELRDLKGDSSKLVNTTGWSHDYTFETMLNEMIDYWLNYYTIK